MIFKANTYPWLIKKFYSNLATSDDKLSYYLMHKYIVVDVESFVNEFDMDASLTKPIVGFFVDYNKEKAIAMFFP